MSSDTFQSADLLQQLKAENFLCEIISVDRVDNESKICLPYQALKSAIYEQRLEMYEAPMLTEELLGLERNNNGRVDHPAGGTQGSKDISDALCGALWNASKHAEEFAFEYGETLDLIQDISLEGNLQYMKQQIEIDMNEEIKAMLSSGNNIFEHATDTDSQFMDFGLGKAKDVNYASFMTQGIII